jgi:hypothetical protein
MLGCTAGAQNAASHGVMLPQLAIEGDCQGPCCSYGHRCAVFRCSEKQSSCAMFFELVKAAERCMQWQMAPEVLGARPRTA